MRERGREKEREREREREIYHTKIFSSPFLYLATPLITCPGGPSGSQLGSSGRLPLSICMCDDEVSRGRFGTETM